MNRARFLTAVSIAAAGLIGVKAAAAALRVRVGDTLHSGTGAWLGAPTRFTYAFQRRKTGAAWMLAQDGADAAYLIAPSDVGSVIRVQVTAYNPAASLPASSQPTSVVRR